MEFHFFVTPETHSEDQPHLANTIKDSSDRETIDFEAGTLNHVDVFPETLYGRDWYVTLTGDEVKQIVDAYTGVKEPTGNV